MAVSWPVTASRRLCCAFAGRPSGGSTKPDPPACFDRRSRELGETGAETAGCQMHCTAIIQACQVSTGTWANCNHPMHKRLHLNPGPSPID